MAVTVPAYAKINLFLDIRSIRDNGYHNIISLMQSVSLCDTVTVELEASDEKRITVFCDAIDIPCDKTNLAYKAAELFPCAGDIRINIEKTIPMSAGLAGGSADCAATLIALNSLTENKLSLDELCDIGARIGADVPFCIKRGAAIVEGIGEILIPIASMPRYPIVIAKQGEGMSTPAAYKALDERFDGFKGYLPHEDKLEILKNPRLSPEDFCRGLYNVFEAVVEPERPFVTEIKSTMLSFGAVGAIMSGSGTSVFGIFTNEEDASLTYKALKERGAEAHICYPV